MTHQDNRSCIYWDGAQLELNAAYNADPSINWIDPVALARGREISGEHIWFAPSAFQSRTAKLASATYAHALETLGVEIKAVGQSAREIECTRCGHGWSEGASTTALTLGLHVMVDALRNRFDRAYIFTDDASFATLSHHMQQLWSDKELVLIRTRPARRLERAVVLDLASFEHARLPKSIPTPDGTRIMRPGAWSPSRWALSTSAEISQ